MPRKQPPSSTASYNVTFYSLKGATPWSHSAVQAGSKYLSVHPITHFHPPINNEFHDPDDTATKLLECWNNMIKPMVSIKMAFGNQDELNQYGYSKVDISVTKEQFEKTQEFIDQQIHNGESGKENYSVFKFFGKSCVEASQTVLEIITESTSEASLAKRSLLENVVAMPQSNFKRAENVSKSRKQPQSPVQVSAAQTGIFSDSSKRNHQITKDIQHDGMEMERLTYF